MYSYFNSVQQTVGSKHKQNVIRTRNEPTSTGVPERRFEYSAADVREPWAGPAPEAKGGLGPSLPTPPPPPPSPPLLPSTRGVYRGGACDCGGGGRDDGAGGSDSGGVDDDDDGDAGGGDSSLS